MICNARYGVSTGSGSDRVSRGNKIELAGSLPGRYAPGSYLSLCRNQANVVAVLGLLFNCSAISTT